MLFLTWIPATAQPMVKDPNLRVQVFAQGLNVPTSMAFLDTSHLLVLEKDTGAVRLILNGQLQKQPVLTVPVNSTSERGLLGIATASAPSPVDKYVFLYYTDLHLRNKVYRYQWNGAQLVSPVQILDLPAMTIFHNGGKLVIGPDQYLYAVIGDQGHRGQLQNIQGGPSPDDTSVIFRVNPADGSPAKNNPFLNSNNPMLKRYFAYGIRNSFGIAFDPVTSTLWDTENGPTTYDEINVVKAGFNSGWIKVMGPIARSGVTQAQLVNFPGSKYIDPVFSWKNTVAPTGIEFLSSSTLGDKYKDNVFVGDFNNGNLYFFALNKTRTGFTFDLNKQPGLSDLVADTNQEVSEVTFGTGFNGITDIKTGPTDGFLYVLSIKDGNIYRISPKDSTVLTLDPITSVPWGRTLTVTGKLTDSSAGSAGVASRTITFSSPNGSPLPASVLTRVDGTYSSTFKASNNIAKGWKLQAHFAGGPFYDPSNSLIQSYNTVKHTTSLAFIASVPNVPWSTATSFHVVLKDVSKGNDPLGGQTIHFTGTGVINVANQITSSSTGIATGTGISPNTVSTGWTYQGQYAGNNLYNPASTQIRTYNTLKHGTSLTLAISPTSVHGSGTYGISGTLTDTSKSIGLASRTVTFTATSPIVITSTTTNTLGQYSKTGLIAPSTPNSYSIQSHYAGESLYDAANSPTHTLTVSTTATAAPAQTITTAPAGNPATGPTTMTPSGGEPPLQPAPAQPAQPTTPQVQLKQLGLPIANAGLSKTVVANTFVILEGTGSYSPSTGGKIVAYQWTQLQMGVPVILLGANTATPTFTAPLVHTDTIVLGFSLRVMDNHGGVSNNPAIVYVMVKHNPNLGQQQQPQHPPQPIVPNNLLPTPSQPNSHQPQIGPFLP